MRIRFAPDMPPAAVEILGPDLQPVSRMAARPGAEVKVEVESERSFVRVHLPSGRTVTLRSRDDLTYDIGRDLLERSRDRASSPLERRTAPSVQNVRCYHTFRSAARRRTRGASGASLPEAVFGDDVGTFRAAAEIVADGDLRAEWNPAVGGQLSLDGKEIGFTPTPRPAPYGLTLDVGASRLVLTLPGMLDGAYVRSDEVGSGRLVSVRISTVSDVADACGAYLARGDYYAAETMAPWTQQAEDLLFSKMTNPYAAAVGGYLLLRIGRYDAMRSWARNLADMFGFLADGCVIWAWQSVAQGNQAAGKDYLLKAAERGLPVYTEGLRLLLDGLLRLGDEGREALEKVNRAAGRVLWTSPFTARLEGDRTADREPTFDVDYMPPA
jgi:hypothetical protein